MKISNSVTLKVLKIHIQQFIKRANTKCDICFYVLIDFNKMEWTPLVYIL